MGRITRACLYVVGGIAATIGATTICVDTLLSMPAESNLTGTSIETRLNMVDEYSTRFNKAAKALRENPCRETVYSVDRESGNYMQIMYFASSDLGKEDARVFWNTNFLTDISPCIRYIENANCEREYIDNVLARMRARVNIGNAVAEYGPHSLQARAMMCDRLDLQERQYKESKLQ